MRYIFALLFIAVLASGCDTLDGASPQVSFHAEADGFPDFVVKSGKGDKLYLPLYVWDRGVGPIEIRYRVMPLERIITAESETTQADTAYVDLLDKAYRTHHTIQDGDKIALGIPWSGLPVNESAWIYRITLQSCAPDCMIVSPLFARVHVIK